MATQREVADHLLISTRMVRTLIDEGVFEKPLDLDRCREAYITRLRDSASGRGDDELVAARARKEVVAAELAEMGLEEARGELVNRAALEAAFGEVMTRFRKQVMAIHKSAVTALGLSATQSRKLATLHERCLNELTRFDFGDQRRGNRSRARRASTRSSKRRSA